MAIAPVEVWTLKNEPYTGSYDVETMTHRITRRYVITNLHPAAPALPVAEVLRRTAGVATYPPWILNEVQTYYMLTGANAAMRSFYLYPSTKRVVNMPSRHCLEIDIEYVGRIQGTHGIISRTQMSSQIRYESIEPEGDGTFLGIGVEFEGVPVDVPMVVHTAIQVVTIIAYTDMAINIDLLAGSVNEHNWESPWNHRYPEGGVIYMGPQQAVLDRATQTYTIYHVFTRLQNREEQHIFKWRRFDQTLDDEGQKVRVYAEGAMEAAKILKIAGTDRWWDDDPAAGTPIPQFSVLGLELPIV